MCIRDRLRTQLLKRIQMVQELIMDQRQKVLSLVSESNAWVSHKRRQRAWHNMMVTNKLGLTHVTQLKIPLLRRTQAVLELGMAKRLMVHSQESELNAWASLKSQANPDMTATHRLGLMTANQVEIHLFNKTVKPELEVHTQVLELNAKDLVRSQLNWLNMKTLGSMTAIQVETHSFKLMVALVL